MNLNDKTRSDIGPEDFGVPAQYVSNVQNYINWLTAATWTPAHADDEPDHGETVLRVQGLLGITQTGWVSPDVIELRIEQLKKAAHAQQDAARAQIVGWYLPGPLGNCYAHKQCGPEWLPAYAAPVAVAPSDATGKSDDLAGRIVSMDVSTGDNDYGNRIFAELTGETGSDGTTLLAIETERNFPDASAAWTPACQPPDADITVMLAMTDGEVWQGYWNGTDWIEVSGLMVTGRVKYWQHTPKHPEDRA